MTLRLTHPAILAGLLLWPVGLMSADDRVDLQQFTKLHALIKPKPEESKWEQIQWLTNLWEARQRAALEGKPILLWEMDGHPLGCT